MRDQRGFTAAVGDLFAFDHPGEEAEVRDCYHFCYDEKCDCVVDKEGNDHELGVILCINLLVLVLSVGLETLPAELILALTTAHVRAP